MTNNKNSHLASIQMLILDVDGVLTDGSLIINPDGRESKIFNALDGHGIRMWRRAGLKVAFLSGRASEPTTHRAKQLEIDHVFENCYNKLETLEQLSEQTGLSAKQMAYIGDDLMDIPAMKYVGFSAAVANAVEEVKKQADYVAVRQGGKGAVREIIEYILKNSNKWQPLLERYMV